VEGAGATAAWAICLASVNFCGNMPIIRWILSTQRFSGLPSEKGSAKYSAWTRETSLCTRFHGRTRPTRPPAPRKALREWI
jgi:hypothetical protein